MEEGLMKIILIGRLQLLLVIIYLGLMILFVTIFLLKIMQIEEMSDGLI